MRKIDRVENLHTLDCYGGPLGVECRCGRKAIVSGAALGAHSGNMRELRTLRFVCRECGSRDWTGYIFSPREDALGWVQAICQRPDESSAAGAKREADPGVPR